MIADALTRPQPRLTPNVPHEFVGQARLFCARIDAAAKIASTAVRQIGAEARAPSSNAARLGAGSISPASSGNGARRAAHSFSRRISLDR
jgi:hypothetical protein